MALQAITWALAQKIRPSGRKFVLVALANYASEEGYCYPGQARLAHDTGQTTRSVREHLLALEADGYVARDERFGPTGQQLTDGYHLPITPAKVARPTPPSKRFPKKGRKGEEDSSAPHAARNGPERGRKILPGGEEESSAYPYKNHGDNDNDLLSLGGSPPNDDEESGRGAASENGAVREGAWSARAAGMWIAKFGGTAPAGRIGKALKPLVTKYGEDEVLKWWHKYLEGKQREDNYKTAEDFASRYGKWKEDNGKAPTNGRQPGPTLAKQEYGKATTPEEATAGWAK
jgi:hypothetical protein